MVVWRTGCIDDDGWMMMASDEICSESNVEMIGLVRRN